MGRKTKKPISQSDEDWDDWEEVQFPEKEFPSDEELEEREADEGIAVITSDKKDRDQEIEDWDDWEEATFSEKRYQPDSVVESRRHNVTRVLSDFRKVHGDRYDYSKVEYVNNRTKVSILCPDHGEFLQTPKRHKSGFICPKCSKLRQSAKRVLKPEQVIREFVSAHGDRYDYSKVDYQGGRIKVTIICREHGQFLQEPIVHKRGHGCPKCNWGMLDTSQQVEKFRQVHGERYDYSKVVYVQSHTKVTIICPEHGEFQQTPTNHKAGRGCPKCARLERIARKKRKK